MTVSVGGVSGHCPPIQVRQNTACPSGTGPAGAFTFECEPCGGRDNPR